MLRAVTREEMKEVIVAMLREAKKGNVQAAQLLLDRCFGKVTVAVEISGPEKSPLEITARTTDLGSCLEFYEQLQTKAEKLLANTQATG
jgi:hypothetical protein